MSKVKKYYWLKLQKDFFKRHDIRIIESMPNGKDYILFYLKLLCESTGHEGFLRFSETIPYNEEMLSTITNTNIDIVRSAVKIFNELHMIDILDDGSYYMNEVEKMLGYETSYAKKQREYRERKKLKEEYNHNTEERQCLKNEDNVYREVDNVRQEIEKELEIEKEIDKNKEIYKEKKETYKSIVSRYTQNPLLISSLNDFIEMRKKMKGFTTRSLTLALSTLDKLANDDDTKIKIVNRSVENSWKSFYQLKKPFNTYQNQQPQKPINTDYDDLEV